MEVYLSLVAPPLSAALRRAHDPLDDAASAFLLSRGQQQQLPAWCTGAAAAGLRAALLVPALAVWGTGGSGSGALLVLLLVIFHDALEVIGGALARHRESKLDRDDIAGVLPTDSLAAARRKRLHRAFLHDVLAPACFFLPLWIFALARHADDSLIVWLVLWPLVSAEALVAWARARDYLTAPGNAARADVMPDTDAVNSADVDRAGRVLCTLGSALLAVPWLSFGGIVLLALAVPLAVERARRATRRCVVYVPVQTSVMSVAGVRFLQRAKSLGDALVVGCVAAGDDSYEQRREELVTLAEVTAVIDEAPTLEQTDLDWMDAAKVDFLVCRAGERERLSKMMRSSNRVVYLE